MGRRKQPPEYFEARRAINQHLYRHHGTTGLGALSDRIEIHEEIHAVGDRIGRPAEHTHEPWDGETEVELAFRLLREGEEQDGQADATIDQG